ncbi:SOS-induced cell division inhibitor SulA [Pseudomonas sp. MS19]|uniref:SOS-induced cell division inhibitor SulA n=1 Tax=Pseudomonas sp. MS19 TaxID=2579939 RepID=UPI0015622CCA|nr:SOS-induced cell division inhibitor SulA [Pseudomonas sp. MS19]NRH29267.1 CDP-glycerol--UDP-pyrophosphoryl-N-acetylglucosaminyl-N-acetylmannosamine glycerophosphotransferase [Pseudomonas sp. MS19]
MQFPQSHNRTQLPLFGAFLPAPALVPEAPAHIERVETPEAFSEISLRGAAGSCLNLLAPMLRELSENNEQRWLTLIAPPASLTQAWLRDAGLNRERILLLHPRSKQTPLQLAQETLRLGRSHTVISWLHPLERKARLLLEAAAKEGAAQSLNISLG